MKQEAHQDVVPKWEIGATEGDPLFAGIRLKWGLRADVKSGILRQKKARPVPWSLSDLAEERFSKVAGEQ